MEAALGLLTLGRAVAPTIDVTFIPAQHAIGAVIDTVVTLADFRLPGTVLVCGARKAEVCVAITGGVRRIGALLVSAAFEAGSILADLGGAVVIVEAALANRTLGRAITATIDIALVATQLAIGAVVDAMVVATDLGLSGALVVGPTRKADIAITGGEGRVGAMRVRGTLEAVVAITGREPRGGAVDIRPALSAGPVLADL